MPSIINQNENMYNGIVIVICSRTTTQDGSLFQNDFSSSAEENNGRAVVVGVWRLLGGGVNNAPCVSMKETGGVQAVSDLFRSSASPSSLFFVQGFMLCIGWGMGMLMSTMSIYRITGDTLTASQIRFATKIQLFI